MTISNVAKENLTNPVISRKYLTPNKIKIKTFQVDTVHNVKKCLDFLPT